MKPFDLEAALKGDNVITRDGRKVTNLTKIDNPKKFWYALIGAVEGEPSNWNIDGTWFDNCILDGKENDLFMAPKTKKLWICVRKYKLFHESCSYSASNAYESIEECKEHSCYDEEENFTIKEIEIEIE